MRATGNNIHPDKYRQTQAHANTHVNTVVHKEILAQNQQCSRVTEQVSHPAYVCLIFLHSIDLTVHFFYRSITRVELKWFHSVRRQTALLSDLPEEQPLVRIRVTAIPLQFICVGQRSTGLSDRTSRFSVKYTHSLSLPNVKCVYGLCIQGYYVMHLQ
jgi:hypothetical protein